MNTKPNDILYCGVSKEKILSAQPEFKEGMFELFIKYVKKRYLIHIRKDVKHLPKPWTKDHILQKYKFTNVRREHDTETKWLIKHIISNEKLCYEDKLLNCILFRLFNKHETAELIGMPLVFLKGSIQYWNPEAYRAIFEAALKEDPTRTFFTGAFLSSGLKRTCKKYVPTNKSSDNIPMRIMWLIQFLLQDYFTSKIKDCKNQKEVFDLITSYDGISNFLGYQMFIDMTYIDEFPFSENEFTVAGIGCIVGLDYLFKDKCTMSYEECLFWLRDNWDDLNLTLAENQRFIPSRHMIDIPKEDRVMNVMSLENCLCEFGKYMNTYTGIGRPRKRYQGGE